MFVDSATVTFIAGKGGDGCASFRREKYIPKGGPDGGDGGDGASIILKSSGSVQSLIDFKNNYFIRAEKGVNGGSSNKTGKSGENKIILVPPGTLVKTFPDERLIFDFNDDNMSLVMAKGGTGGRGNARFKSSTNQAPKFAQRGKPGETIKVILELKLIAFAGLVGFPNAGKSTLISRISGAKPKIANYPFTTLTPSLGVVYHDYESLVVADIPGIIEGAHEGQGMGLDFLKHIERNKVLIYLLDVSPYADQNPVDALEILRDELNSYNPALLRKKSLVVANKIDLLPEYPDNPNNKIEQDYVYGSDCHDLSEDLNEDVNEDVNEDLGEVKLNNIENEIDSQVDEDIDDGIDADIDNNIDRINGHEINDFNGSIETLEMLREYCAGEKLPLLEISAMKEQNLSLLKQKLFELYHEV